MYSLRIAHLTDPHFSKICLSPLQFFSKRWIGNLNLFFLRKKALNTRHLWKLIPLFKELKINGIFITGDFATTALNEEFEEGLRFVKEIEKDIPTFFIPGNHDYYTKKSEQDRDFYRYFSPIKNAVQDRIECRRVSRGWWWIGLDTALATSIFSSHGHFFSEMQEKLEMTIQSIPETEFIIIGNHFPLFSTNRPKHDLKNAENLQKILKKYPNVKIYLHGHDHSPYIIDRQSEGYPLSLNPGSCSLMSKSGFNLLDLEKDACIVHSYQFEKGSWTLKNSQHFHLN